MLNPDKLCMKRDIAPYEKSSLKSSVRQIINSFVPFLTLWFLAYQSLSISYWLTLAFTAIASGFVIRIFILFHDCCHQSFFKGRTANEVMGTITGIIAFFPYYKWRHDHTIHHATSSNLNKRGTGDVWILTVQEYMKASKWKRLAYRFYRNPFVMFGLGPIYIFFIDNRINRKTARRKERLNTYMTNFIIAVLSALMIWIVGWQAFLIIQLPMLYISGAAGIWLFYVQHQFEDSFFAREEDWDFVKAAVNGSSYYKLPKVLQWITGNIGFHHVHHLNPRIPNYNLEKVHDHTSALQDVTTITIASSLPAIFFRLWDEQNRKFIGFQEMKSVWAQAKYKQRQEELRAS